MKIKEIIVVEGKDDTVAVKNAVDADTIETNGSAINEETIEKIRLAQQTRGVIILTDPDFPGQKIRNEIIEKVPGCKHAFIERKHAKHKYRKGVGVEYVSPEEIRKALADAHLMIDEPKELITIEDLVDAKLLGGSNSKPRRERLGEILKIGYANGKQLHKRLIMFQITKEQFIEALLMINQEETNA